MRGRPVLGGVAGVFFGMFLALLIQQFGIRPLDDQLVFFGLPGAFLVGGVLLGLWAPFGRRKKASRGAAVSPDAQEHRRR